MITTDICIIGAGPVGLFAVFEAGLLGMKCHLVDVLPQPGGQLTEIYPKKPIYDIPGYPEILAGDLVKNQMEQIAPFKPTWSLGQKAEKMEKRGDNEFVTFTTGGDEIHSKVIVIAGGLGVFEPRKPPIENLEDFEHKGVDYFVKDPEVYRGKKLVLAGGGDSALDWTVFLSELASELTLVHRTKRFRGAPDSVEKVFKLAEQGKINLHLDSNVTELRGNGKLDHLVITNKEGWPTHVEVDNFIPLFGLKPELGPLAGWGLEIEENAIKVDNTLDYQTNVPGVYAIGDINTYPGKLKLILCGYHEAALMAQSAWKRLNPDRKFNLKYTTVNGVNGF
jgi:thioredoxin reductase (NADPH)